MRRDSSLSPGSSSGDTTERGKASSFIDNGWKEYLSNGSTVQSPENVTFAKQAGESRSVKAMRERSNRGVKQAWEMIPTLEQKRCVRAKALRQSA